MDKLCKDCRYFLPEGARCEKMPEPIDFVNGGKRGHYSAQLARETRSSFTCTPEAIWFEAKAAA